MLASPSLACPPYILLLGSSFPGLEIFQDATRAQDSSPASERHKEQPSDVQLKFLGYAFYCWCSANQQVVEPTVTAQSQDPEGLGSSLNLLLASHLNPSVNGG